MPGDGYHVERVRNVSGVKTKKSVAQSSRVSNKALDEISKPQSARHQREKNSNKLKFFHFVHLLFIFFFFFFLKLKHSIGKLAGFRKLLIA